MRSYQNSHSDHYFFYPPDFHTPALPSSLPYNLYPGMTCMSRE